jgi:hypothetical protein
VRNVNARRAGTALALALAACATPPPESVATPVGTVRADDPATARWIAEALERAAERLERRSPGVPAPRVEVWVVDDPGGGDEGVSGRARRGPWSTRWTLYVDAELGWSMVGHELFHARFHERVRGWPAALVEGLADHFGLPDDILGDRIRVDRLMALSRARVPPLTLEYRRLDGTKSGMIGSISSTITEGPPPLELDRIGDLRPFELDGLGYPARLYAYGVGYAAARAWVDGRASEPLPASPPSWSQLLPRSADELACEASGELTPARMHRWAVGRVARVVARILCDVQAASIDEALAQVEFSLSVDGGPRRPLNDDADFRELLDLLWPNSVGRTASAASP